MRGLRLQFAQGHIVNKQVRIGIEAGALSFIELAWITSILDWEMAEVLSCRTYSFPYLCGSWREDPSNQLSQLVVQDVFFIGRVLYRWASPLGLT